MKEEELYGLPDFGAETEHDKVASACPNWQKRIFMVETIWEVKNEILCLECGDTVPHDLSGHLGRKHGLTIDRYKSKYGSRVRIREDKQFECACGEVFDSKTKLNGHQHGKGGCEA